jgi:hypothetical protein
LCPELARSGTGVNIFLIPVGGDPPSFIGYGQNDDIVLQADTRLQIFLKGKKEKKELVIIFSCLCIIIQHRNVTSPVNSSNFSYTILY